MVARALTVSLILFLVPAALRAQRGPDRVEWYDGHVSVMAGVSVYDQPEVSATGIYALRADMPIYPGLLAEAGLAYARPDRTGGVKDVYIPSLMIQLQRSAARVNPYVGLGGGVAVELPEGGGSAEISFSPSLATGVRIAVSEGAGIRVEGRVNAVGANVRAIYSEITAGLIISW